MQPLRESPQPQMKRIQVIDSHTGGEPTRIIVAGGPDLGAGSLAQRREKFQIDFDEIRSAVVDEPRGSDVWVGGLICESNDPTCSTGVIFFTTVGFLGMCGHGTIGLVITLRHLGRIKPGIHRIETPVGPVTARLESDGRVAVQNVPSYRYRSDVKIEISDFGTIVGDIAWGGNWFFLVNNFSASLARERTDEWIDLTRRIRRQLAAEAITGAAGAYIDHVELFGPPVDPENDSRNFVLCPGGNYDRSPCGTGTSAKLACLAAEGRLQPGETWRQESIVGSVFECSYQTGIGDQIIPTISGTAHISAESTLILDPNDPFCMGIRE